MPDALMKTVPIWCAVFNRVLFPENEEAGRLYTPPKCVSRSEHSQIEKRLDGFARDLRKLQLDIAGLREKISKPLRPIWVTRDSELPETPPKYEDFHPVVLCTASRRVAGGEMSESGYIQGAGDDAEGWAHGLTPILFWKYKDELIAAAEEELSDLIAAYLGEAKGRNQCKDAIMLCPTSWLYLGSFDCLDESASTKYDVTITIGQQTALPEIQMPKAMHLHLECRDRKLGSRDLRTQLPNLKALLGRVTLPSSKILVSCANGKDLSAGVALAILCLHSETSGKISRPPFTTPLTNSKEALSLSRAPPSIRHLSSSA